MLPKEAKKSRLPRVARSQKANALHMDDTSHLWAISYADFLMVLLSFFVIFFSTDKNKRPSLITNIVAGIKSGTKGTFGGGGRASASEGPNGEVKQLTGAQMGHLRNHLQARFPTQFHSVKLENEKIIIEFPDNFFGVGQYTLNEQKRTDLRALLDDLRPFASQIAIGFVGHTDTVPVLPREGRSLENNVDMSVMRASRALGFAIESGFDSSHLYATGSGSELRNTRSLSIVVKAFGVGGVL